MDWMSYIYKGTVLVWLVSLVFWTHNCLKYPRFSNSLHKMVTVFPCIKIVHIFTVWYTWDLMEKEGSAPQSLTKASQMLCIMSTALVMAIFLLASDGWCIMRPWVTKTTLSGVGVMLLVHLLCRVFLIYCGDDLAFQLSLWIVWINDFIACCTVSWHFATINSRILVQEEEFALRDFECEHFVIPTKTAQKQIKFKLDMFKKLKVGVQFYCFFVIIIYFLSLLLYPRPFQELFLEGADIFIFAFLAMVFHLKDFSEYEGFHYLFPRNTFVILRPFADSFCPKEEQFMIGTREFTRGSDNEGPVSLQKPTHI